VEIVAGADGAMWFTGLEDNRVWRVTTDGTISSFEDPAGAVEWARGITAGSDGAIWFTSLRNDRIGRITTDGAITTFADPAGAVDAPEYLATGPDCQLWFTSLGHIGRIDSGVAPGAAACPPPLPAGAGR
jgi:virginiamycin B lyase